MEQFNFVEKDKKDLCPVNPREIIFCRVSQNNFYSFASGFIMVFLKKINKKVSEGFTIIELLVVIAIIALLASYIITNVNKSRRKARDTQRLANIQQIVKALEFYYQDNNSRYPGPTCPCGAGGWESSSADSSQWLESLAPYFGGAKTPVDPINTDVAGGSLFGPRPGSYYFAYYRYNPPGYCACDPASQTCSNVVRPIAILAIRNLEDLVPENLPLPDMPLPELPNLQRAFCGDPGVDGVCTRTEYIAGNCRDWSMEFDYSIMLTE